MRLNELKLTPTYYKKPNNIIKYILKNCSDIIQSYKKCNKLLYSGMQNAAPEIFVSEPINRKIVFNKELKTTIDNHLSNENFIALRSNSIFCISNFEHAKKFGNVYVIFPLNGFNYTYSLLIKDLNTTFDFIPDYEYFDLKSKKFYDDAFTLSSKQFIKKYKFLNQNLDKAILNGNEVYIRGKYVALRYDINIKLIQNIMKNEGAK